MDAAPNAGTEDAPNGEDAPKAGAEAAPRPPKAGAEDAPKGEDAPKAGAEEAPKAGCTSAWTSHGSVRALSWAQVSVEINSIPGSRPSLP